MRTSSIAVLVMIATGLAGVPHPADAQQLYCAMLSDGTRECGIPTLSMCQQTVSGAGGYCAPDQTSQLRPNLVDRLREDRRPIGPPPNPNAGPNDPNWMPPPPGQ